MPKRGENVRKRKDRRWEGRFISSYKPDGKAKYQSVYGNSYMETKQKLLQATEKQKMGALPESCKNMSFREALFLWLQNRKLKLRPQTYYKYEKVIENHLAQSIGNRKLSKIDCATFNQFIEEKIRSGRLDQKGGLSISYVRTLTFIIRSTIKFAVENKYCLPLNGEIGYLPKKKQNHSVFTVDEQRRLETYVQTDIDGAKLGVLICLHTGLRIGEVCGLKWSDIDFEQNTLSVQRTVYRMSNQSGITGYPKTKLIVGAPKSLSSYRIIPIPSYLIPVLIECQQKSSSEWVTTDNYAVPDPRTYQYRFKRYLKECALPYMNFHVTRHCFATRCIEVGVDIKSLSEMLGHSNVSITLNTYVHSSLEQKRNQIELLGAIRGQNMGQQKVLKLAVAGV